MNPYSSLPDHAFWRRAVATLPTEGVDPVVDSAFRIAATDAVATAGSCFAQHIARTLTKVGFHYLVTETGPRTAGAADESFGVFPARFGNVYTVRQLLQLFERAYGLRAPLDSAWARKNGGFIDPFRPRIQEAGFASAEAVLADRVEHLRAVRSMFERCDVFIFTLGLTEGWVSVRDGAVFPLAPGVVGAQQTDDYAFKNFTVAEMVADFGDFLVKLRLINPEVRVVLTVSPVPLIASYEKRHVLVSNTYSKSALRVVAEEIAQSFPAVEYFPSYEIITGAHAKARFYEDDLREVSAEGVAHVMSIFTRHYLADGPVRAAAAPQSPVAAPTIPTARTPPIAPGVDRNDRAVFEALERVMCDEQAIEA